MISFYAFQDTLQAVQNTTSCLGRLWIHFVSFCIIYTKMDITLYITLHFSYAIIIIGHTMDNTKADPRSFRIYSLPQVSHLTAYMCTSHIFSYYLLVQAAGNEQLCLTKAMWQMKVAIILQGPTEAKLCLNPSITKLVAGQYTQVTPILNAQQWTVVTMLPDGNCLF